MSYLSGVAYVEVMASQGMTAEPGHNRWGIITFTAESEPGSLWGYVKLQMWRTKLELTEPASDTDPARRSRSGRATQRA